MLHDLIFLHANHDPHCTAQVDKRFDGYFSLQLMTRGHLNLSYNDARYELSDVCLWACWPGPQIRFGRAPNCESWEHRYAAFSGALPARWREAGLWPQTPLHLSGENASTCTRDFDELLRLLGKTSHAAPTQLNHWRAVNQLERILLNAAQWREQERTSTQDESADTHETWLQEVLDWLHEPENAWPDYTVLAARCNMATGTLRRRFRQKMGVSLHEYVLNRRITRARELLIETDFPIKQISEQLGYSDVFFFAAQFRQRAGLPPAAYRRSRQLL